MVHHGLSNVPNFNATAAKTVIQCPLVIAYIILTKL
jgi:hypothetical protein